jgi:hypothetical protein
VRLTIRYFGLEDQRHAIEVAAARMRLVLER